MKKMFYFFKTSWKYFKGYKKSFVICFLLKLIKMVAGVITPLFFSTLITGVTNQNADVIKESIAIIVILSFIEILISYLSSRIEIYIKKNVNFAVKNDLFTKLLNIPQYGLNEFNDGKLFSIISSEATTVSSYIFFLVGSWLNIINIVVIGFIIFSINWQLSLIILISYPLVYIINHFYGKKTKRNAILMNKKSDEFIGFYKNTISNFDELKNRNQFINIEKIFIEKNSELKNHAKTQEKLQENNSLYNNIIGVATHILFLIAGAIFVINKTLSLGYFISFNTYSRNFSSALKSIVNLNANIQPSIATLERIDEINIIYNESRNSEKTKENPEFIDGDICFENLEFSFGDKKVLSDISLKFVKGKKTAIIGKNGTGKTTLSNLITRKYLPNSGTILINGININQYKYKDLQKNIAYARQRPNLFYMTILENLLLFSGSENCSQNEIEQACSAIGLLDDIKNMPEGFATTISDKTQISVGQVQKIQIARTLLQNAPIIIFDEVTANLDKPSREQFYDIIKTSLKNKTILFITHKDEELEFCDYIYQIESGNTKDNNRLT